MVHQHPSLHTARWFFVVAGVLIAFLFWKIIEPFVLTLVIAGIAAIMFAPVDRQVQRVVRAPKLSAFLVVFAVFALILLPLIAVGFLIVQQASDLVRLVIEGDGAIKILSFTELPFYAQLPVAIQQWLSGLNVAALGAQAAGWVAQNIGGVFAQAARFAFQAFIFFVSFYYLLVDRHRLYALALELSPFKDKIDSDILERMKGTVRGVVFGAIVIAIVQGVLAGIGMTIFGVPGAVLLGAVVVIAAQIPMVGAALVLGPAVLYLWFSGEPGAAIGLAIWSVVAVGLIDNILSPYLVSGKTKMHGLLILLAILGGIQAFGPAGFVIGPTVLAALMVLIDLYRRGVLEKYAKVV